MPFVYVVALVGALGGMLFGFDTGAVSGAILYLKRQFVLSPELQELVTSIALVGQSLSYLFCRHNGRKLGFQFELVEHRKAANVRADCCPEFSERSKELGLLIDEALLAFDESWFAAGTPNAVFKLTPTNLVTLSTGRVESVAVAARS